MSARSMPSQVVKDSPREASAGSQTKKSRAASGMPMATVRKIRSPGPRRRGRVGGRVRGRCGTSGVTGAAGVTGVEDTVRETFPVLVRP